MIRKKITKICCAVFLQLICCSELLRAADAENVWEQFPGDVKYYNDDLLTRIANTITKKDTEQVLIVFKKICTPDDSLSQDQYQRELLPRLKNAAIFLHIRHKICNNDAKAFARYLLLEKLDTMHRDINEIVKAIRTRFHNHVTNKHLFLPRQGVALDTAIKYANNGHEPLAVYIAETQNVDKTTILNNILENLFEKLEKKDFSFNDNCYEEKNKMILFQCGLPSNDGYQIDWRQEMPDLFNVKYAKLRGVINGNRDPMRPTGVHFELKLSDTNVTCGTLYPRVSTQTSKKPQ